MIEPRTSLLEFPCNFPIKAFGRSREGLDVAIVAIVRRHAPDLAEGAVVSRSSGAGKFTAVTVTVRAKSQAQLDAIYRDLSSYPEVLMVL